MVDLADSDAHKLDALLTRLHQAHAAELAQLARARQRAELRAPARPSRQPLAALLRDNDNVPSALASDDHSCSSVASTTSITASASLFQLPKPRPLPLPTTQRESRRIARSLRF